MSHIEPRTILILIFQIMSKNIERDLCGLGAILGGQVLKTLVVGAVEREGKLKGLLRRCDLWATESI